MDGTEARVASELMRLCPFRRMKGEAGPCGQGPAITLRKGFNEAGIEISTSKN